MPGDEQRQVGAVHIERTGRQLSVQSAAGVLDIVAFAGPAPGRLGKAVAALKQGPAPDLALLIGGVGDELAAATDTLTLLSALPFPTLVLPGGRDPLEALKDAWDGLSAAQRTRIWLLAGHHLLQLGEHQFVLVAGAEDGRYALQEDVCGFDANSLQHLMGSLAAPAPSGGRWLLSWTAPAGKETPAVARTPAGLEVGSSTLAGFAANIHAQGGLFAWPAVRAAEPMDGAGAELSAPAELDHGFFAVVPRLGGPALQRADGSQVAPGYLRVRLQGRGLHYLGMTAAPGLMR